MMIIRFANLLQNFRLDRAALAIAGLATIVDLAGVAMAAELPALRSPSSQELAAAAPVVSVLAQDSRTPFGLGLIAVAAAEALVTKQQLDKAMAASGPEAEEVAIRAALAVLDGKDQALGLRFGLDRAVTLIVEEIQKIKPRADAAADVTRYQAPAIRQAKAIMGWADQVRSDGAKVALAKDAAERRTLILRMSQTMDKVLNGADANNDGRVSWAAQEGGLAQLHDIMGYVESAQGVAVACPTLPAAVSPILAGFQRDGFSCDMIRDPEQRLSPTDRANDELLGRNDGLRGPILAWRR